MNRPCLFSKNALLMLLVSFGTVTNGAELASIEYQLSDQEASLLTRFDTSPVQIVSMESVSVAALAHGYQSISLRATDSNDLSSLWLQLPFVLKESHKSDSESSNVNLGINLLNVHLNEGEPILLPLADEHINPVGIFSDNISISELAKGLSPVSYTATDALQRQSLSLSDRLNVTDSHKINTDEDDVNLAVHTLFIGLDENNQTQITPERTGPVTLFSSQTSFTSLSAGVASLSMHAEDTLGRSSEQLSDSTDISALHVDINNINNIVNVSYEILSDENAPASGFIGSNSVLNIVSLREADIAFTGRRGNLFNLSYQNMSDNQQNSLPYASLVTISGSDTDGDAVYDVIDAFPEDIAAAVDTDGDGAPDHWNAGSTQADSTTGLILDAFPADIAASVDSDNDGYPDQWNHGYDLGDSSTGLTLDIFPHDPTEHADFDGDGMGDNADLDDDNDGMSDEFEILYGLDPFDPSDADLDSDGDGATNLQEFEGGSDPTDISSTPVNKSTAFDYDGDGKADVALRRPGTFYQYILNSADNSIQRVQFGRDSNDIPVSGDFDGDSIADIAVRRASTQYWYIKNSSDGEIQRHNFGKQPDDIPVPADYDGDGISDLAVRRPSTQVWYIKNSSDGEIRSIKFGLQEGDIPVPADYDGDGKADVAVRRPSTQYWYIKNSSDGEIQRIQFGRQESDIPVPADYDGDGKADVAVRRPNTQFWYIKNSSDGEIQRIVFGRQESDIPIPADYDGDGKTDVAVRRPGTHFQYILNSSDGEIQRITFGRDADDIPIAAPINTRLNWTSGDKALLKLSDTKSAQIHRLNASEFEVSFGIEESEHF